MERIPRLDNSAKGYVIHSRPIADTYISTSLYIVLTQLISSVPQTITANECNTFGPKLLGKTKCRIPPPRKMDLVSQSFSNCFLWPVFSFSLITEASLCWPTENRCNSFNRFWGKLIEDVISQSGPTTISAGPHFHMERSYPGRSLELHALQ